MAEIFAMAHPAPERFDGADAWSKLPADVQALIGSIALELPLVWHLQDIEGPGPESGLSPLLARVARAADSALMAALEAAVCEALPPDAYTASDGGPRIPAFLGDVCRVCGCSQENACDEGCGWAAEDLCTACVGGEGRAHD